MKIKAIVTKIAIGVELYGKVGGQKLTREKIWFSRVSHEIKTSLEIRKPSLFEAFSQSETYIHEIVTR